MQLTKALALANGYALNTVELAKLSDILSPDFQRNALKNVVLQRLGAEVCHQIMAIWAVLGMFLYCHTGAEYCQ